MLFQGIFSTQGLNPVLLHCKRIRYHLSHQGSPILGGVNKNFLKQSCQVTSVVLQLLSWAEQVETEKREK